MGDLTDLAETQIPYFAKRTTNLLSYLIASFFAIGLWFPLPGRECQASGALGRPGEKKEKTIDFVRDIQPILKASCYACHGSGLQMGQLRLDSKQLALQGGHSGQVIIPGKSEESPLVQRILGLGDRARMPLQGEPLTRDQINRVRAWIDQGAPWPDEASLPEATIAKHWAYIKPARPEPPIVKNQSWVCNPIDSFVLARLEKEGLTPSPEANRETLIRRVSLDLIGLPPSLEEIDAFLADQSPDAYEKVVDRLLASPHYGERWARPWLDLARYADTNGYADNQRTIWKYRDWVIHALNKDMPFDEFTIEQIAGDMLPNATTDQKIATGFHRNTMVNDEGGVDLEEARWITVVDRVGTTASAWLGTTLACTQCHNHKYDPFTQKEFYQFFAFFENADYRFGGAVAAVEEPVLDLPTPEQENQRKSLRQEIAKLEVTLNTQTPELEKAQAQWEREEVPIQTTWHVLDPVEFTSKGGATLTRLGDQSVLVTPYADKETYTVATRTDLKGITAFQLEVLPDKSLPAHGPGRSKDGNFILTSFTVHLGTESQGKTAKRVNLQNPQADFSQIDFPVASVLDDNPETGWAILPQVGQPHAALFQTETPLGDGSSTPLTFILEHQSQNEKAAIGRFRISASTTESPQLAPALPEHIRIILNAQAAKRTEEQKNDLSCYYRSISPLLKPTRDRLFELTELLRKLPIVTTLVMQERPSWERPFTYLRVRGSFLNKGQKVYAGVPAVLHPLPESQLANRLGLAHWLVDKNNPLVARVTVNRFWEQIFGRGIVETAEDFGTRGARPTHPELLDWLATEFMQARWSMKAMHRLMVTSATYRQSSHIPPDLRERDPTNELWARGPRFRLEAEMIRDVVLAASGQLCRTMGGPSVFPFQPEGIWNQPYYQDYHWATSQGCDGYRRGLYTFWRRTTPYPSFMNFDASSREFCNVRRIRTNTPLQALTALNDLAFFDAAKGLAKRILVEAAPSDKARATYGFRLCVSRYPKPKELDQLLNLYHQQLQHFQQDPQAGAKIMEGVILPAKEADPAEFSAWTVVSNLLLNMDETLTKE
jgi:hypothetical protein